MNAKSLFGCSVVVTRAREQALSLCNLLHEFGAEVLEMPVIEARPLKSTSLAQTLERLTHPNGSGPAYDWLVFTSSNGVRYFKEALKRRGLSFPRSAPRICAVGPMTAEAVKNAGFPLCKVAEEFRTAAIPRALGRIRGRKVLLARVRRAPEELEHDLAKRGALVEKLSVYETIFVKTISASLKQRILSGVDWVTFTSSSTVHSFMRLFSSKERKWIFSVTQAASIGPVTSATLREYGIRPAAEAKSYTAEGLAKAVLNIEFPLPARERVRVRGKCR